LLLEFVEYEATTPTMEEGYDADDGILEDMVEDVPPVAAPPPAADRGRRRGTETDGSFWAWLVADAALPEPAACTADLGVSLWPAVPLLCVGVVRCSWKFVETDGDAVARCAAIAPPRPAGSRSQARGPWGFVEYNVVSRFPFRYPQALEDDFDVRGEEAAAVLDSECGAAVGVPGGPSVRRVLNAEGAISTIEVLAVSPYVARLALFGVDACLIHSLPLTLRQVAPPLVEGHPSDRQIRAWRKGSEAFQRSKHPPAEDGADNPWADIALELPRREVDALEAEERQGDAMAQIAQDIDPIQILRSLDFSQYLRDQRFLQGRIECGT